MPQPQPNPEVELTPESIAQYVDDTEEPEVDIRSHGGFEDHPRENYIQQVKGVLKQLHDRLGDNFWVNSGFTRPKHDRGTIPVNRRSAYTVNLLTQAHDALAALAESAEGEDDDEVI